ncbi:hypothetical protein AYO49_00105 [Verrucomicrobiaceae bacterium SCGC AG-212-N21]|nr:hypothetical protein AYO49_00105 [Verrucomicrobiaceae bacterium SCGC AG-212-N21]
MLHVRLQNLPVFIACGFALASPCRAAPPGFFSLGDLNQKPVPFHVTGPGAFEYQRTAPYYFPASDDAAGNELWVGGPDEGSEATRAQEIRPGPESSNPSQFASGTNCVVFVADDGVTGPEMWRGRTFGANRIADLQSGSTHGPPTVLGAGMGRVYFSTPVSPSSSLVRLWSTTGSGTTQHGTFLGITNAKVVEDVLIFEGQVAPDGSKYLFTQTPSGSPRQLVQTAGPGVPATQTGPLWAVMGGNLYYRDFISTKGWELVRADLRSGGPALVNDIATGLASSDPGGFAADEFFVYFAATTILEGRELWKSDGTASGTELVKDILPGTASSNPQELRPASNGVLFLAADFNGWLDLWFASPVAGSGWLKDNLNLGSPGATWLHQTMNFGELLYWKPTVSGFYDLWAATSDGNPAVRICQSNFTAVQQMWVVDSAVYVNAVEHHGGGVSRLYRMWLGDSSFTIMDRDIRTNVKFSNPRWFAMVGTGSSSLGNLWAADMEDGHTALLNIRDTWVEMIPNLPIAGTQGSFANDFVEFQGKAWFIATNSFSDGKARVNVSDGVLTGPIGSMPTNPRKIAAFKDRLYCLYDVQGTTTRRHLGYGQTVNGTSTFTTIPISAPGEHPSMVVLGDWLYYLREFNNGGEQELHIVRGSDYEEEPPITFLKDANNVGLEQFMPGQTYLFFASPYGNGREVYAIPNGDWESHATTDWINGNPNANPKLVGALGDTILFRANDGTAEFLWAWSPAGGQSPLKIGTVLPTLRQDGKASGVSFGGRFFFVEDGTTHLWSTNGTAAGTGRVGSWSQARPEAMAVFQDKLFFVADQMLVRLDTAAGSPVSLATVTNGVGGPMLAAGPRLYFAVYDTTQCKCWCSDGTAGGTALMPGGGNNLSDRTLAEGFVPQFGRLGSHAIVTRERRRLDNSIIGNEPWLINHRPGTVAQWTVAGLRNQPVTFTHAQIVAAQLFSDIDGDPFTINLWIPQEGQLTVNGIAPAGQSVALQAGDTMTWQPPADASGLQTMLNLSANDPFEAHWLEVLANLRRPVDLWVEANFTAEQKANPNFTSLVSDPDGDGINTGLEFLMGQSPTHHDGIGFTTVERRNTPQGQRLCLRFVRNATLTQGTSLTVETSDDLLSPTWTAVASKLENGAWSGTATIQETSLPAGRVQVEVICPMELDGPVAEAFVRLSVGL